MAFVVVVLSCATVSGCSVDIAPSSRQPLVVGSSADPSVQMAARIYRQVLVATGAPVAAGIVVGDDAAQLAAMGTARRDLFPAFTGRLLSILVPPMTTVVASSTAGGDYDQTYVALNRALPQGVSLADPTSVTLSGLTGGVAPAASEPAQQLVPVYRSAALDREQLKAINKVAGELTADDLVVLVRAARTGDPAALASRWVVAHGL